ncbi:DNA-directed RNA polymerase I subunit [Cyanidioschyzon merolae strain 10D]|jgi:DNA-directed RNA polymerase subunit M/transcription elongation factor TFIIS|uniref:DNA-directed RNA polymerase I subunit n=1 Tax=Cyanidioschyzon merolae (strain NIES-3377 / 10D) TaxID=280699 RepID=M1UPB0_CYAM1|nr:DNA-directed RNA polymerase I subunit [Cyanidioschyzon merolae strain 10D]BAM79261.1 DNA-directed RNA polymerase I subunit [Cyanidioschyzon merolae strain 10D]|eukprot:XP_005535547.1 DNA-directed RNA polymerase I subunit [Cyanidioschyzon merolae strain 10D]
MASIEDWVETQFCDCCGRYREPVEAGEPKPCVGCGSLPPLPQKTIVYEVPVRPTQLLLELQAAYTKRVSGEDGRAGSAAAALTTDPSMEATRQVVRGGECCPKCNSQELYYETVQMRSADEGQTILYECCRCRTRFTQHS